MIQRYKTKQKQEKKKKKWDTR